MAHALPDARSVLLLRASRNEHGRGVCNIRWNYGHATIPRHLRDLYVTEHGIADLRGKCDEDCVIAMAAIAPTAFQQALLDEAKANRKLRRDFAAPAAWQRNTSARLGETLAPFRRDGTLPDYPLGSDFTPLEQGLVKALGWLKARTATRTGLLRTIGAALSTRGDDEDDEALQRMQLHAPSGISERINARLLRLALRRTA
jgi:hypothetical protein